MQGARNKLLNNTDIVVPIYNEEETIPELLHRLREACPGARMIFVDNASTDRTIELLVEGGVTDLVLHDENLGYGRSLLDGMRHGSGDHVIVIDADLEYWPEDIPAMLEKLREADAVIGSRFLARGESPPAMQKYRSLGNGLVTGLFNLLFRQRLTDLYTGIRAFERRALPLGQLESSGFEFVLELSARLAHAGVTIAEVPAGYTPRSTGSSKMRHIPEFIKFVRRLVSLRIGLGSN
ncbi:MAG: glycosyltransferase family 2 protein [Candidatus Binatia bacterium]|nr:glycosyltransferase family 2 protein [Candidatus Binatia bacterium]